jgi:hypothetical protein
MKLHEEFKEYENLWEDYEPTEVDKLLWDTEDFEFEYEGWEEEGYEDHFDPGRAYGHYQTSSTYKHDDFTYAVDAVDVFETLRDEILPKVDTTKVKNELILEYKKLEAVWEKSKDDADADVADMFLAKNLEDIANTFYSDLEDYYSEKAYDWARS